MSNPWNVLTTPPPWMPPWIFWINKNYSSEASNMMKKIFNHFTENQCTEFSLVPSIPHTCTSL